jgi:hypothetical protein
MRYTENVSSLAFGKRIVTSSFSDARVPKKSKLCEKPDEVSSPSRVKHGMNSRGDPYNANIIWIPTGVYPA